MSVDISFFGFVRFYFALMCPWCALAISSPDGTGWEYFSLHLSLPSKDGRFIKKRRAWYFGWAWDTGRTSLMFGPWKWEKADDD